MDPLTHVGLTNLVMLSPLLIFEFILPATPFIRSFEFISFVLAGMTMYFVSNKFARNELAAILSGLFYMIVVETSQYFEGHVPLMLSFAIFPFTFLEIYNIIKIPNIKNAIILASTFYILFDTGDLGAFYMIVVISLFELIFIEIINFIKKASSFEQVEFCFTSVIIFLVSNVA